MKMNPTIPEKYRMNYEYSQLISSLLLAHYMGTNSDVAIRQCAKRVHKRLTNKLVINIARKFREVPSPFNELTSTLNQIEDEMPVEEFLRMGFLCGEPSAHVLDK